MLPADLYTKGVPGLDEAILAEDYAVITGHSLAEVIATVKRRQLLGALYQGVWYVEAPAFCEDELRSLQNHKRRSNRESEERYRGSPPPEDNLDTNLDRRHGKVLGLSGQVTRYDVKTRWRELSRQYHPDNVQHLGPKLREVAEQEMKAINLAYEYFKKKYSL